MHGMPARIELDAVGAVLRRHRADDLDALQAAIEESRDLLRPFMFWADQSRDDTAAFLAASIEAWDAGREHNYLIVDAGGTDGDGEATLVLGGAGLHDRIGPSGREIGYWRRAGVDGRGIVTAAAAALTEQALALRGVERVEIHCDEANARSAAVPRRLGYRLERLIDAPIQAPGQRGCHQVWVITAAPAT